MIANVRRRLRFLLAAYRSLRSYLPARPRGPFAPDVASSLTEAECRRLAELARGKTVLEVGSWFGRSTIALASTATSVHAVDPHEGDADVGPLETLAPFVRNLKRYGARERVVVHVGRFEEVALLLAPRSFDLVFIDGFHRLEAVRRDTELALNILRDGGTLAFHDYGRPQFGVTEIVQSLEPRPDVTDSVAVVEVSPDLRERWRGAAQ